MVQLFCISCWRKQTPTCVEKPFQSRCDSSFMHGEKKMELLWVLYSFIIRVCVFSKAEGAPGWTPLSCPRSVFSNVRKATPKNRPKAPFQNFTLCLSERYSSSWVSSKTPRLTKNSNQKRLNWTILERQVAASSTLGYRKPHAADSVKLWSCIIFYLSLTKFHSCRNVSAHLDTEQNATHKEHQWCSPTVEKNLILTLLLCGESTRTPTVHKSQWSSLSWRAQHSLQQGVCGERKLALQFQIVFGNVTFNWRQWKKKIWKLLEIKLITEITSLMFNV